MYSSRTLLRLYVVLLLNYVCCFHYVYMSCSIEMNHQWLTIVYIVNTYLEKTFKYYCMYIYIIVSICVAVATYIRHSSLCRLVKLIDGRIISNVNTQSSFFFFWKKIHASEYVEEACQCFDVLWSYDPRCKFHRTTNILAKLSQNYIFKYVYI
jgi:hypothetical protein